MTIGQIMLIGSLLLFVSIIANKSTGRLGVPALLIFLIIGMLAGSDGPGQISFNDPQITQWLGIVALTFILFSGGLETKWESVKPIVWKGLSLSTIGVLVTAFATGLFAYEFLGFTLVEGLLLGAIVSSTDAAAVFSILRSRNIGLKGNIRPLLELESGSNDPMAYLLTILFTILLLQPEVSYGQLVFMFFKQIILGTLCGVILGKLMVRLINVIRLEHEGLYPVLVLACMLFCYSATEFIGGNGFLAVYMSAIVMGNSNFVHKKSIIRFYDGQAWLVQIIMFLTLGLLVFPADLIPLVGPGILISLFLILVARPVGVFISLAFSRMKLRERLFISWVGLRGAVPIVFATYPLIEGVSKSNLIFNLVFFIVITSVAIQGTTLPLVAKLFGVYKPKRFKPKYPLEIELSDGTSNELREIDVPADASCVGKSIIELNFPKAALIVLIRRNNSYMTPNGSTMIMAGDKLLIMADDKQDYKRIAMDVLGIQS